MSVPFVPPMDSTTEEWWEGTKNSLFLLQHCASCGYVQHPPRPLCTYCGMDDIQIAPSSGIGVVDSFTIVRRGAMEGFTPPYVVARVVLREGPIILTNLVGCPPDDVSCGDVVTLAWLAIGDERQLPVFQLAGSEDTRSTAPD